MYELGAETWNIDLRMVKEFITRHSGIIVFISIMLMLIFYYCAVEVEESSFKIHLYGNSGHGASEMDWANLTTYDANASEAVSGSCNKLYEIARDMLAGERVKLPFETKRTRWKFHKRGNLDILNKTSLRWNYPWKNNLTSALRLFKRYRKVRARDLKVKKYFITFANNCCKSSKIKAIRSARFPGGFDFATAYGLKSLSNRFRHRNSFILRQSRGSGYWLWKPYIILKTLVENMVDGDILMYQDAGAYLVKDAGPLLKLCQEVKNGIVVFYTRFSEKYHSKRDAFVLMDMDDSRVYESLQRIASFVLVRRNCRSLQFVMEWMAYASDPRILTDMDNQMGKENLPEFVDNRHDQTVLSLLSKKWEILGFRDPSQHGSGEFEYMYAAGPYEQLINHTRDKN